ncbi:hypothetical protein QJS10_CPB15g00857 [Acorus calamus]|uniref:Transposase Tnp1/En/Spm-like domain-containing protein n=1 Tax=Acorus calamus TaxID=4465 RepID=A0AAV9D776_ACOCL|nr:hypothetical protein QJS10_CPB15g00857 [Acorus calamus]
MSPTRNDSPLQKNYTRWTYHGETISSLNSNDTTHNDTIQQDDIHEMLHDAFGINNLNEEKIDPANETNERTNADKQMNTITMSNMNNQVSNVEPQPTPDPRFTNQTPNLIVAQGTIISKNPHTRIRDTELGHRHWEVIIRVPIAWQELLPRPFGRFRTVGDAAGWSVAWPSTYSPPQHVPPPLPLLEGPPQHVENLKCGIVDVGSRDRNVEAGEVAPGDEAPPGRG